MTYGEVARRIGWTPGPPRAPWDRQRQQPDSRRHPVPPRDRRQRHAHRFRRRPGPQAGPPHAGAGHAVLTEPAGESPTAELAPPRLSRMDQINHRTAVGASSYRLGRCLSPDWSPAARSRPRCHLRTAAEPSTGAGCAVPSPDGRCWRAPSQPWAPPWARCSPAGWPSRPRHSWSGCSPPASSERLSSTPSARTLWAGVVDRAEGRLRADLLDAAMAPAVVRAHGAGRGRGPRPCRRRHPRGRHAAPAERLAGVRTLLASGPLWIVAGLHVVAGVRPVPARRARPHWRRPPLLPALSSRKVVEETAWTDHAAAMEEGVAARDDLRTEPGPGPRAAPLHRAGRRRSTPGSPTSSGSRAGSAGAPARCSTACSPPPRVVGVAARPRRPTCPPPRWSPCSSSRRCSSARSTCWRGTCPTCRRASARCIRLRGLLGLRPRARRRRRRCPTGRSTWSSATCTSPTPTGTFALQRRRPRRARPARPAPSSGAPGPASPRSPRCCPARSSPSAARCCWAASTSSTSTCSSCAPPSASSPSAPRSWPARSRRTSRSSPTVPRADGRARGRRARPRPPGWPGCPTGSTRCSARAAPPCPPVRSSWSPSPGCSCATSGSSCSTRPPPAWTRSPRPASSGPPTGCSPVAPASSSPTGSRRPSAPSRSPCSRAAASSSRVRAAGWPPRPGPFRDAARGGRRARSPPRGTDPTAAGATGGRHGSPHRDAAAAGAALRRRPGPGPRDRARRCSSSRSGAWSAWRSSWSPR